MGRIEASIENNAPHERVWELLALDRFPKWDELASCYRIFYGSWRRKIGSVFSSNKLKSRLYRHMVGQGVLQQFKNLIPLKIKAS